MADSSFNLDVLMAQYEVNFSDLIGHTPTLTNTPTIVSATPSPPTGAGASAKFVRASSMVVDYGASTAFDPGAGDFTAEAFFNVASLNSFNAIITKGDQVNGATNLGWGIFNAADTTLFGVAYDGTTRCNINAGAVSINTWYHTAFCRAAGTWSFFFNGNRLGTSVNASGSISNATRKLCIGGADTGAGFNASDYLDGAISYARVTVGLARYSGLTYVVPSIPNSFLPIPFIKLDWAEPDFSLKHISY